MNRARGRKAEQSWTSWGSPGKPRETRVLAMVGNLAMRRKDDAFDPGSRGGLGRRGSELLARHRRRPLPTGPRLHRQRAAPIDLIELGLTPIGWAFRTREPLHPR